MIRRILIIAALALGFISANAAPLTAPQRATLKTAIFAETNPTLVAARNNGDTVAIANWYNGAASGPVKCWRNDISRNDLVEATVDNLAIFDNLSAGKRDAWVQVQNAAPIDATRAKFRSAPGKIWASTERDSILSGTFTRNATRAEVVIGGTVTVEGTVSATRLNWQGDLTPQDVVDVLSQ